MMSKKIIEGLELGNILIHPIRYRIIKEIKERQKLCIQELTDILGINRRNVSFHLSILNQYGFVEGNYDIMIIQPSKGKGKTAKYFRITPKVDAVLCAIDERIREMKSIEYADLKI